MRRKNLEVYQAALKLAGSGKVKNWKDIEERLVADGFERAPDLFDGQKIRAILDLRCVESRKSH